MADTGAAGGDAVVDRAVAVNSGGVEADGGQGGSSRSGGWIGGQAGVGGGSSSHDDDNAHRARLQEQVTTTSTAASLAGALGLLSPPRMKDRSGNYKVKDKDGGEKFKKM